MRIVSVTKQEILQDIEARKKRISGRQTALSLVGWSVTLCLVGIPISLFFGFRLVGIALVAWLFGFFCGTTGCSLADLNDEDAKLVSQGETRLKQLDNKLISPIMGMGGTSFN